MLRVSIILAVVLVAVGCDGGPKRAPVSGAVKLDGKPLTTGTVLFVPQAGGPYAKGTIGPDGSYELQTDDGKDGAVLGSYFVGVMAFEEKGRYRPNYGETDIGRGAAQDSGQLVPAHYMDPTTSGITYEVKPGSNQFAIELSSQQ